MKQLKQLAVAVFALTLMNSCKKDDAAAPAPPDNSRIKKILYDDHSADLSYNADGSIKDVVSKDANGTVITSILFSYAAGKITEATYSGTKWRYTYTGNNITRIEILTPANTVARKFEYTYTNGRITEQTEYNNANVSDYKVRLSYTGNNADKMELFDVINSQWVKTGEVTITGFDTKKNYITSLENYPYVPVKVQANNPLTEVHKDEAGQVAMTVTHTYTYDAAGRAATRRTVESVAGQPDEVTVTKFFY